MQQPLSTPGCVFGWARRQPFRNILVEGSAFRFNEALLASPWGSRQQHPIFAFEKVLDFLV
jgi:hypothetical protein